MPWPMILHPQWLHLGASTWIAHSKQSNVWVLPRDVIWNALS